jgi:superfamily I DNA/RNA helicase
LTNKALLNNLNPQQLKAVTYTNGSLLVLAGAGSGKTRVLTTRMLWLVNEHNFNINEILAVTFTNKAAKEMIERLKNNMKIDLFNNWIGTFHSLATKIIRNHTDSLGIAKEFTIIDVDDQWRILKKIINEKIINLLSSINSGLYEITLPKNQNMKPRVRSKKTEDGKITSGSIDVMWPFLGDAENTEIIEDLKSTLT